VVQIEPIILTVRKVPEAADLVVEVEGLEVDEDKVNL
jgi:hypothetical protein